MKIKLSHIIILMVLRVVAPFLLDDQKYEKVPSTFLSLITNCVLSKVSMATLRTSKTLGCLSLCSATTNCSLACNNDDTCNLYSALVAPYWNPTVPPFPGSGIQPSTQQNLLPFNGYKCFSSWNFQNDLTTKISNVSSSPVYDARFQAQFAIDGYFCDAYDFVFSAKMQSNNWYQIDMGTSYAISKIIIKCRRDTQHGEDAYFQNVQVKVGNTSGSQSGNFAGFASLGNYSGPARPGEIVTFTASSKLVGRFISFQSSYLGFFSIGEIKVLG